MASVDKPQDAQTSPEGNVEGPGVVEETGKVPFKDQVAGYAKKFAGQTFGKEHEVKQGEARLQGEPVPPSPTKSKTSEDAEATNPPA